MSNDAMVPVATLFSRSEALSVAAMLDASGVIVHVGGEYYAGTTLNVLAMGGFRLTVPASQLPDASAVLRDFASRPPRFNYRLRRRALTLLAIIVFTITVPAAYVCYREGNLTVGVAIMLALSLTTTPLSPQARGEYYLVPDTGAGD